MLKYFSQAVVEKINYYVYCLADPESKEIFYIGHGNGNRVFNHLDEALGSSNESDKLNLIRLIRERGLYPEYYILRHGLEKNQAIDIESTLIDFSRLFELHHFKLTNLVRGHHSFTKGLKTATEISQFYDARVIDIQMPTLIIIVNKLYSYEMDASQLYEIVHEKWRLNRRNIKKIRYVVAAYLGLVREIYRVSDWYDTFDERTQKMRVGFNGVIAEDQVRNLYLDGSLEKYRSNGTPFLYVNC
jgi:hypothetical protein